MHSKTSPKTREGLKLSIRHLHKNIKHEKGNITDHAEMLSKGIDSKYQSDHIKEHKKNIKDYQKTLKDRTKQLNKIAEKHLFGR